MATTPLREYVHLAEQALADGRPADALRRCDQLLATHPRWLDIQCIQAEALIATGQIDRAIDLLDQVLACHPEETRAFVARATALRQQGDRVGELACLRRACELVPEDVRLREHHNQLASQLGRAAYSPSHTGLARLYLRSELYTHALREWDIALQANPQRLDAQVGIAETFWRLGDVPRATEIGQSILREMPLCLKPLLLVAYTDFTQGRREAAQKNLRRAGELDPEMRVVGELFADLVAAGDIALGQWLRETARALASPFVPGMGSLPGRPTKLATQGRQPGAPATSPRLNDHSTGPQATGSMPVVPFATGPLPQGQAPTSPLFPPAPPPSETLFPTSKLPTYPSLPGSADEQQAETFFSLSRSSMMSEDFQRAFSEVQVDRMLWRDDSSANGSQPSMTAAQREPEPSKAELDFVRWLQEQGAQPLRPVDPAASSPLIEPPPFLLEALRQAAAEAPPATTFEEPKPEPPIVALPPTMPPIVEAAPAPLSAPSKTISQPLPPSNPAPAATNDGWPTAPMAPPGLGEAVSWPAPPIADLTTVDADSLPAPRMAMEEAPAASFAPIGDAGAISQPAGPPPVAPPEPEPIEAPPGLTIEAIEQGLSSSGFARHETGRLASVASMLDDAATDETVPDLDVPSRLGHARELRHAGKLAEALGEYRVLVKAQNDQLPQVVRALMDAAIEQPDDAEIQRLLGDAHIRLGNYIESLDAYNRASALQRKGA